MVKKYIIGAILAMALLTFGLAHEAMADGGFGGTGSVTTWGGAANVGSSSAASAAESGGSYSAVTQGGGSSSKRPKPTPVPEPSSLILLASGVAGLVGMVVMRRKTSKR
jgi:hypothetical protein